MAKEKAPADLELELEAANKKVAELTEALAVKDAEFEAFKTETIKEIESLKKESVIIVKGPVVEHEGKKYEITRARFGVLGIKGMHVAEEVAKNADKYSDLIKKMVETKSAFLKPIQD